MREIVGKTFDEERALYGSDDLVVKQCKIQGPADGESALKESSNIKVEDSFFDLRYPFWHDYHLIVEISEMTINCRAPLWYSRMLKISRISLEGKYSFQYIEDALFEDCTFDTKDAFWHAKDVTVRNCKIKGEYLGWYSENLTLDNCTIIGTQALCYCKGLRLINCEMIDCDLSFEKSEVEAELREPIKSIKNPASGHIIVPYAEQLIIDDPDSNCVIDEVKKK